jgi:hypothetical protein
MNSAPYLVERAVIDVDGRKQGDAEARGGRRLLDLLGPHVFVLPRLRIAAAQVREAPFGVEARVADARLVRQERAGEGGMRPGRRQAHGRGPAARLEVDGLGAFEVDFHFERDVRRCGGPGLRGAVLRGGAGTGLRGGKAGNLDVHGLAAHAARIERGRGLERHAVPGDAHALIHAAQVADADGEPGVVEAGGGFVDAEGREVGTAERAGHGEVGGVDAHFEQAAMTELGHEAAVDGERLGQEAGDAFDGDRLAVVVGRRDGVGDAEDEAAGDLPVAPGAADFADYFVAAGGALVDPAVDHAERDQHGDHEESDHDDLDECRFADRVDDRLAVADKHVRSAPSTGRGGTLPAAAGELHYAAAARRRTGGTMAAVRRIAAEL